MAGRRRRVVESIAGMIVQLALAIADNKTQELKELRKTMSDTQVADTFQFPDDSQAFTLADIAAIQRDAVKDWEPFSKFPAGNFDWEFVAGELITLNTKNGRRPAARVVATCTKVHAVKDQEVNPDELIGDEHTELILFNTPEAIGALTKLWSDAGFSGEGSLEAILKEMSVGHKFTAKIKHTVDANDEEKKYVNFLDVKPMPEVATTAV